MADNFADRYWSTQFWTVRYFQGGEVDPNAMSASLSGSGGLTATLTALGAEAPTVTGGGDSTWWRSPPRKKKRKKTPDKAPTPPPVIRTPEPRPAYVYRGQRETKVSLEAQVFKMLQDAVKTADAYAQQQRQEADAIDAERKRRMAIEADDEAILSLIL
jgi:hypothetical protein